MECYMRNDGERLYISRKNGRGMSAKYILRHYAPSLIVFLVVLTLTFIMVFISSMTGAIERMIVLLGSGSVSTSTYVDVSGYKDARIDEVKEGDGILYSSDKTNLVHLKGVNIEEYFSSERGEGMNLELLDETFRNDIVISSSLSSLLGVGKGDRMTLLLYEKEKDRARPVLVTVRGIFSSGYAQLDKYLGYVDISLLDGDSTYEILLSKDEDTASFAESLWKEGIYCTTYKEKYASLCNNVNESIMILNIILILIAFLAAFFSIDIAHVYITEGRDDIKSLRIMGMSEKSVRAVYRRMTLSTLSVSSLLGILIGTALSHLAPSLMRVLAENEPEIVEYYISSFTLSIPYLSLIAMFISMLVLSGLTLRVELYRRRV